MAINFKLAGLGKPRPVFLSPVHLKLCFAIVSLERGKEMQTLCHCSKEILFWTKEVI
jgi:hypothetical protein